MRTSLATTLLFPAALFAVSAAAAGKCYGINGGDRDSSFVPCNPAADVSACCASNKAGGDLCIANGLCLAAGGAYTGFIYGNGCTDKSGKDSACPSICPLADSDFWGKSDDLVSWNLLQCNPGTWCCRRPNNATSCCNDKRAQVKWNLPDDGMFLPELFVGNTVPLATTTKTSSAQSKTSTTTRASSTSATTTPGAALSSATNTPGAMETGNSKNGVDASTVGIAVGVSMGALLLVAIGVIVWLISKNRSLKRQYTQPAGPYVPPTYYKYAAQAPVVKGPPPVELHSPPSELHAHASGAQYPQYGNQK